MTPKNYDVSSQPETVLLYPQAIFQKVTYPCGFRCFPDGKSLSVLGLPLMKNNIRRRHKETPFYVHATQLKYQLYCCTRFTNAQAETSARSVENNRERFAGGWQALRFLREPCGHLLYGPAICTHPWDWSCHQKVSSTILMVFKFATEETAQMINKQGFTVVWFSVTVVCVSPREDDRY